MWRSGAVGIIGKMTSLVLQSELNWIGKVHFILHFCSGFLVQEPVGGIKEEVRKLPAPG